MRINFYDDPSQALRAPEDVRISRLALTPYPDGRRLAVAIEITPFRQRPSLELTVTNARGEKAASLTVIETLESHFTLTLHLRDKNRSENYEAQADLYYLFPDRGRTVVATETAVVNIAAADAQ